MKFLIYSNNDLIEEVDGIANGLSANGHEVLGFTNSIYKVYDEHKPDYLLLPKTASSDKEIVKFVFDRRPALLALDFDKLVFPNGFVMNLPAFANTMKYKPELPSKDYESDVCIVYDGKSPIVVHDIYERYHKKYRIRIVGAFINSPGFVGMGSIRDLVKFAKSSKMAIVSDGIIANTLIYNGILSYACVADIKIDEHIALSASEKEKRLLYVKSNLITEHKLGQMIIEKLSNPN